MRWALPIVFGIVMVCQARPARADIAGELYGDVRDVIEDLIQSEVATSVVRVIEERSPALAFYMHGTLERLGSPYWGSLGRVMRDDLTIAVSDFVYWHLSTGGGDGDVVGSAKRFFSCVTAKRSTPSPEASSEGCKRLLAAVALQHRPLLEVECRRQKPTRERSVACHVGLAVLAALQGRSEVRHHMVDALGDIVLDEVADADTGARMRDVLTRWLDLPKDLPTPLLEALGNPDLAAQLADAAIEKRCGDPKLVDGLLADPSGALSWVCFAVTHPALPAALGATVRVTDKLGSLEAKIDYWVIEVALKEFDPDRATDDTAFRLLADLAFDAKCPAGAAKAIDAWPCKGTRLAPGSTVTVAWLGRTMTATVNNNGALETKASRALVSPLLRFRKLVRRIADLRALVPPSMQSTLFYAGSTPVSAKAVLRSAHRMARLVGELRTRWYLWSQNTKSFDELDVVELLTAARDSLGEIERAVNEVRPGTFGPEPGLIQRTEDKVRAQALAFLDKHSSGLASRLDIGDWLRMVMRGDYRSLAMETLRAALDLPLESGGSRPRETFFLSLAAYLLDTSEGVNEQVARSAFKAAAKELLLSASHKGVPRNGDRFRFRALPRLAVKLGFNDVYAVTDGDSRRRLVSADWPTAMLALNDYVGFEVSILDPIAPLAEMALRPPGTYSKYAYVALDAVRPRAGMWIAAPQFSRRVALTAGFGARFLDVIRDTDDASGLVAHYGYRPTLTFDAGVQFVF